MNKHTWKAGLILFALAPMGIALADWDPGDGHKMHFPQLPDEDGWDVRFHDWWLADDWTCSKTGLVEDIHFWVSFQGYSDNVMPYNPGPINVEIRDNLEPDAQFGYSRPGAFLWGAQITKYTTRWAGSATGVAQGWLDPGTGQWNHPDHSSYFQINIDEIDAPFGQDEGTVYWLLLQFPQQSEVTALEMGWKTADVDQYPDPYTGQHYIDDAVWGAPDNWTPLIDPRSSTGPQISLDLAFVITPEPTTMTLLGLGGLMLLKRRRRA